MAILVTLLDISEKPTRPPTRKLKVQSAKLPMTSSQKTTATRKTTDPTAPSINVTIANINITTDTSAPSINITKTQSIAIITATSAPNINITTASSINVASATSAPSIYITTTASIDIATANIASSIDTTTQEKKRKSTSKNGMRKHKKKLGRRKGEQTDRQKNRLKLKGKPRRNRVEQPINEAVSIAYHRERNHG